MSGFDTLIYTDCRAGQGMSGGAGMQFQSSSAGWDTQAMEFVQRNLLYETPPRASGEVRVAALHPPSFGHVYDGTLAATAAGVYLGRQVNGGREGNHLTHSIVTRDLASYGLVRPAQLFEAEFWTTEPAPTTVCPPLPAGWRPGPVDAVSAQEFVHSEVGGEAMLLALLSELERGVANRSRQVLFIAAKVRPVLSWLTAATLLMPQQLALRVTFKVFTVRPTHAGQLVIAIHPEWNSSAISVRNDLGYVVFDLVRREWSEVEITDRARYWVRLFLREDDPYDVVDAVEVAAGSGLGEPAARVVGTAAVLRQLPEPGDAEIVVSWLRTGPGELVAAYGPGVLKLFVETSDLWSTSVLAGLDEVTATGRCAGQLPAIRLPLLQRETDEARRGWRVPDRQAPPPPPAEWRAEHDEAARHIVMQGLAASTPDRFGAILQVARRFHVDIGYTDLGEAAKSFINYWADNPHAGHRVEQLSCGRELEGLLRDELNRRLRAITDPEQESLLGLAWGEYLESRFPESDEPLDAAILAAMVQRAPDRHQVVARYLDRALRTRSVRQVERTLGALWRYTIPSVEEARWVCTRTRRYLLDPAAFPAATRRVLGPNPYPQALDAMHELLGGCVVADGPLAELMAADKKVLEAVGWLNKSGAPGRFVYQALHHLPPSLFSARHKEIFDALLGCQDPSLVIEALQAIPEMTPELCSRVSAVPTDLPGHHAALAYGLAYTPLPAEVRTRINEETRSALVASVQRWIQRAGHGKPRRAADHAVLLAANRMSKEVGRDAGERWAKGWQRLTQDGGERWSLKRLRGR